MTSPTRLRPAPQTRQHQETHQHREARPLLLGTRGSLLATTQARWLADQVSLSCARPVELVTVSTTGDESDRPIEQLGGTGVFVTALREALLNGDVDFVVHSCKDLPAAPAEGIRLAAVPVREDPRDALICRDGATLADLPAGARIGTGSPRRAAQILAMGYSVTFVPMRGNVDTRLRRLAEGHVDAVILAVAGLARLGRTGVVSTILEPYDMLPAPAQGALAVECRADDEATAALLSAVDHGPTRATVTAERSLLATFNAGCTAPLGALATLDDAAGLCLDAFVATPDGSTLLRRRAAGRADDGARIGRDLALAMLAAGAADLLDTPDPIAVDPRSAPHGR